VNIKNLINAIVVSAISVPSVGTAQCPRYNVRIVHAPPCQVIAPGISPRALNGLGQCAGGYASCGIQRAYVWTTGSTATGASVGPGVTGSAFYALNSSLQAVGVKEGPGGHQAFLYQSGIVTNLGYLPDANQSEATGINESGQICGWTNNAITGPFKAFLWQSGVMSEIQLPTGPYHVANAINNHGQIVGWMGPSDLRRAFLWDAGNTIELGLFPGALNANAFAVSDNSNVAGWSLMPSPSNPKTVVKRGFFWRNGLMTNIGVLQSNLESLAYGVNDKGQVVGYCINSNMDFTGFVWQNASMYALEKLISPTGQNLHIQIAWAINNNGQIAAEANFVGSAEIVAVLLTPVPPVTGDVTCDQIVNMDDLLGVITRWSETSNPTPTTPGNPADLDGDGTVGLGDLLMVVEHWTH
jgi:probable HAF family extracellular repeat protein